MAMNPMQRKANNYLLIGIFSTLLVTGAIIAFLFMNLTKLQQEKKKEESAVKNVYVLSTNVKSGEEITMDKVTTKQLSSMIVSADTTVSFTDENDNAKIAKIDLSAGTLITNEMLTSKESQTTKDLRNQEYSVIVLPSTMQTGDYIDVRLRLSNGVDFIVVSKKQVEIPQVDGLDSAETIKIKMTEEETQTMSNAIIEAYIDEGSILYATTYVEPGIQESVTPTYIPSEGVRAAILNDPNVSEKARGELNSRYTSRLNVRRALLEPNLNQYAQDMVDNIESKVQEEITKAKQARVTYLESLGGY